tara:strand:- start:804 stop:1037 length:234 start_codon:yes stop_codon:yes gene_type:complete
MLATSLVFGSFIVIVTAIVSGMLGWVLREYMFYHHDKPNIQVPTHPEMYDEHGNIIPDSVIAFRFDPTLDDEEDDND